MVKLFLFLLISQLSCERIVFFLEHDCKISAGSLVIDQLILGNTNTEFVEKVLRQSTKMRIIKRELIKYDTSVWMFYSCKNIHMRKQKFFSQSYNCKNFECLNIRILNIVLADYPNLVFLIELEPAESTRTICDRILTDDVLIKFIQVTSIQNHKNWQQFNYREIKTFKQLFKKIICYEIYKIFKVV